MSQQEWFDGWFAAERAAVQAIRKAARDSAAAMQRERALRGDARTEELKRLQDQASALGQPAKRRAGQPAKRRPAKGASRTGAAP